MSSQFLVHTKHHSTCVGACSGQPLLRWNPWWCCPGHKTEHVPVEGVFSAFHFLFEMPDMSLVWWQGLQMLKTSQGEGVEGLPQEQVQQLVSMRWVVFFRSKRVRCGWTQCSVEYSHPFKWRVKRGVNFWAPFLVRWHNQNRGFIIGCFIWTMLVVCRWWSGKGCED